MRVTMLGCGGSGGVPLIGDRWGACDRNNPKNRRRRVSVLVEWRGQTILVDTSPDLRAQFLDAGTSKLDAVLWTHDHADHVHGIDELRAMNRLLRRPIDAYSDARTLATLRKRFDYVFEPHAPNSGFYKPWIIPHEISGPFRIGEAAIEPFEQNHGYMTTLGFRFGRFAYSTDLMGLPEDSIAALQDLDLWIVDCLRYAPHPTHLHLDATLALVARVKPGRAILTHMDIELDYDELQSRLPDGVEPGYDGLVADLPD
jgi:phosphoribosyl 1,2-cyclic phosphate phosphodiesterase